MRHSEETGEEEFLNMCVSVSRRKLDPEDAKAAQWSACDKPLLPFEPLEEGLIESAHECLQVDFANAYIGGGVLGMGNVQVRFHARISMDAPATFPSPPLVKEILMLSDSPGFLIGRRGHI